MTDTVVAEGQVKFRDGKKWKTRWVVLRKPSPVADCLSLLVYKEKKGKEKGSGHKERLNVTLEGICGVEPGPGFDGVSYSLSILCLAHTLALGFNSREALLAWDARVRYSLGEVHRFSVNVETGTKLESGPASLHLCNNLLVLTRGIPPITIGHWKLSALRRYGAVPNGFVFEGGTRCGYWAGVFFLSCSEGEQISFLFDCIVRGISPSKAPHGLRPVLPDLSGDPVSTEERISQEASELEKRLSMLSHCSLASSTASTYSCSTSVAGDDQSSISSSSSSQSDVSYGGRPPFWVEPSNRPHLSNETASSSSTLKALTGPDDRLYAAVMGSPGTHPSSSQLHSRGLNDSGRQSSLDSGIGITAGSQSSYSGSFFSYAGSLDTGSQGGGEEFGSVSSLPASLPSSLPPSTPPPPPPQSTLTPKHSSSTSTCNSRSSSCASHGCREEHQTPSLLRLLGYDSPRNVLHTPSMRDPFNQKSPPELCSESKTNSPTGPVTHHQTVMQHSHSRGSERMPSVESEGRCIPRPWLLPREEETQLVPGLDTENYITTEQWQSARNRCLTQVTDSQTGLSPSAHTQDSHLCVREEQDDVSDRLAGVKRSSQAPSARPPLPAALSTYRPSWACGTFQSSHPSALLDTGLRSDSSLNYVNIPTSRLPAKSNGELLYTALDLQGPSSTPFSSPHSAVRDEMYVHLDITAMETAQRVGAEHVQARENRLTELGGQARRAGALTPQRTTR